MGKSHEGGDKLWIIFQKGCEVFIVKL